ncbi:DNA ligase 1-like [Mugil cephalus]|uniref:DNA ligase 1-like n=1 Tax=Mugil cephalus TaxID=48193 RepID=UPI001FB7106E|nr:DNA ligase 1-like [Mugil cephalus]
MKSEEGPLSVYNIPLKEQRTSVDGCRWFSFGEDVPKQSRTIMVLGATGAGKSTLINGMINYILDVKWEDSFRFKLVHEDQSLSQAHSQTSEVTVYKINHQEGFNIPYSLTIVDTPGFGDTRGIESDRKITEQIRKLFSSGHGVTEIDAVCVVVQAALARLTPTQKYVFDSVLSIFGKDVAENIRVLVTFADGQKPPVLEAINAAGVPCPKTKKGLPLHFKFNNSALFADNKPAAHSGHNEDDDDGGFDQMFWVMGTKSMTTFFGALNKVETKSLTLTKEVLRERQQLEISVENLQVKVKVGLAKMEEMKETKEKLKEFEAEINRNENFEFEVTVTKPFQYDISGSGNFITNCQQCHFTCHYPCGLPDDRDKARCWAMGSNGYCKQCPGKCYWKVHFNQKYRWEYQEVKEKQTVKELKEKYLKAKGGKTDVQTLIDKLKDEYDRIQGEVVNLIKESTRCLNRLKEIALKPNPLSTPEYIDMLIEGEKAEAKPGWKKRVESLMKMKQKAEFMAKVEKGENLLSSQQSNQDQQDKHDTETKTNKDQDKDDNCSDIKDQDKSGTDRNQEEKTNRDQDKEQTEGDQDKEQTEGDQDKEQTEGDQDEEQFEGDQDEEQSEGDQDEEQSEGDQDEEQSEGDQDEEQSEGDQNEEQFEGDQDEEQSEGDQDEEQSEGDQDEEQSEGDQDEEQSEGDQDEEQSEGDQDEEQTEGDQDEEQTEGDQDEEQSEGDQDEEQSEGDQDEEQFEGDQDKEQSEGDQDEEQTEGDQDEEQSEGDQDEEQSDSETELSSDLVQDVTGVLFK